MSLDRSLKGANALVRHRNVLTRDERLVKLAEQEKWNEAKSVFGLPKVAHRKQALAKAVKEEATADAAAAGTATAATPAAGSAPAKGAAPAAAAGKGAAPAKGTAPAKGAAPAAGAKSGAAPAGGKKK